MNLKLTFICLLFFSSLNAQQYAVQELAEEEIKMGTSLSLIPTTSGYYSVMEHGPAKFGYGVQLFDFTYTTRITSYNSQMKVIKSVELFDGKEKLGPFTSRFFKLGSKEIFVYFQKQEGKNVFDLNTAEINPTTLELMNIKKIFEIDPKNVGFFKLDQIEDYRFFIETSVDKQRILFFWASQHNNKYIYSIVDNDRNILKSKETAIEAAQNIAISNVLIDNNNAIYINYRYFKDKRMIWNVLKEDFSNTSKNTIIEMDNATLLQTNILQSTDEKTIKICGSYTINESAINGICMQTLDQNSMTVSKKINNEIPDDLMNRYIGNLYSSKKENKKGLDLHTYFVPLVLDNNTVCMLGEVTLFAAADRRYWKWDILVALIKNNNISFINFPKTEEEIGGWNGAKFYAFTIKDKVVFFYNSKKKELADRLSESLISEKKKSYFVTSSLSKDGVQFSSLISGDIGIWGIESANVIQQADGSLLIPFRYAKGLYKEKFTYYLFKPVGK